MTLYSLLTKQVILKLFKNYIYSVINVCYYSVGGDFMDNGDILFQSKTDDFKNGIAFLVGGLLAFIGANFIYAKIAVIIIGVIFILIGLFLLIFKRRDTILICENVIILSLNKNERIYKKDIESISYKELKNRKSPISSYYPVLLLSNGTEVLLNISFNRIMNKDFEGIINSYLN